MTYSVPKGRTPSARPSVRRRWKCGHGCDMKTGQPCVHLERIISPRTNNSVKLVFVNDSDKLSTSAIHYLPYVPSNEDRRNFIALLKKHGLGPEAIELLYAKFVDGQTLEQITADQGYTSKQMAGYYMRKLLRQLRVQMGKKK